MTNTWKTVRVFISSTFRDMQAERDWLVKRVFPALRQRLEPHRIHLIDIDLRWGITRQQADNDQVLGLCLQQIDECRPFFLGLLGGRYGWVPSKFPVEVGTRYGWTQAHTGKSVTELEILHGVLTDPAMHGRALFCFRDERFLNAITDEQQRCVYVEGPTYEKLRTSSREELERHAKKRAEQLDELKKTIQKLSPPMPLFDGYPCQWNPTLLDPVSKTPGRLDGLKEFGDWVIEKLEHAILNAPELKEHLAGTRAATRDELAEERGFHEQFIENRTRVYVGRQQLQDDLKTFVTGAETKPCLVTGPSGCGKSAALAKFLSVWRAQHPQDLVIAHFVGASPHSTSLREMLRHLCAELKDALKLKDEIKQDVRELSDQFREFITKVPSDRRVLLVLDALNQLDETKNAHSLYWLPTQIPPHVRLMVSCIDDPDRPDQPALVAMRRHAPHEIKVGLLTDDERLGIVREIPSVAAKTLDEIQIELLLKNPATKNPLFLIVALEELRGFGSFEELNRKIAGLPQAGDTLTAIFQQVIRRLGEDFNGNTVKDVLTLLACARRGLSERELLDQVEGESVRVEDSASDLFPILRQLRPYLQTRGPLLDFFYRHLAKATHGTFFRGDANKLAVHRRIADYFDRQPWFLEPIEEQRKRQCQPPYSARPVQVRKVDELPWQRLQAQQWDELGALLIQLDFLEAKNEAGFIFELRRDYSAAVECLPPAQANAERIRLLNKALGRDISFIAQHSHDYPQAMFQCLWNSCWWFDCPELIAHLQGDSFGALSRKDDVSMHSLMNEWRARRERLGPFVWIRTLRPPQSGLRSGQTTVIRDVDGMGLRDDALFSLASSSDGKLIACGGKDGTVRVFNVQGGDRVSECRGHTAKITGIAFLPGSSEIVSSSEDKSVRFWNADQGQEIHAPRQFDNAVSAIALSPDGLRIAVSVTSERSIHIIEKETWTTVAQLTGCDLAPSSLCWSKNGYWLASCTDAKTVRLVGNDLIEQKETAVRLWNINTGLQVKALEGHSDSVSAVAFSPESKYLASGSQDRTARIWNCQTGEAIVILRGHEGGVSTVAFSPDGKYLATGCWTKYGVGTDKTIRIWDTRTWKTINVLKGHESIVTQLEFLSDAEQFVSISSDNTIRIWKILEGADSASVRGHAHPVNCLVESRDGKKAVSGSMDDTLRIWDFSTGQETASFGGTGEGVGSVAMSPDMRTIIAGAQMTPVLRILDADSGVVRKVLKVQASAMAFSPDGRMLACGSGPDEISIFDTSSWREIASIQSQRSPYAPGLPRILCLAFSPDMKYLARGSLDGTLGVWDPATWRLIKQISVIAAGVNRVAFTDDNQHIVVSSWNDYTDTLEWNVTNVDSSDFGHLSFSSTDVKALAAGASRFPIVGWSNNNETRFHAPSRTQTLAWFPDRLEMIVAHPDGKSWCGVIGRTHVQFLTIEGDFVGELLANRESEPEMFRGDTEQLASFKDVNEKDSGASASDLDLPTKIGTSSDSPVNPLNQGDLHTKLAQLIENGSAEVAQPILSLLPQRDERWDNLRAAAYLRMGRPKEALYLLIPHALSEDGVSLKSSSTSSSRINYVTALLLVDGVSVARKVITALRDQIPQHPEVLRLSEAIKKRDGVSLATKLSVKLGLKTEASIEVLPPPWGVV